MMLATWLVEIYLSRCNELEDVVASESVSHDVENLRAEKAVVEEDLRHFLETYRVCSLVDRARLKKYITNVERSPTSIKKVFLNSSKVTGDLMYIFTLRLLLATMILLQSIGSFKKSG